MSALQAEPLWQESFPDKTRPELYTSNDLDEDGFKPLADPQEFLANLSTLTQLQLYTLSSNNVLALRSAQEEYSELSREIAAIKGRDSTTKNPQALQDPEVFEERKEATLYNYKYETAKPARISNLIPFGRTADDLSEQEKRDVRLFPEPFSQGGFVPTDRQFKGMSNRAKNLKNIDGWEPIERDGKFYIPVQQQHHDEYTAAYTRRALDENGEVIRPVSPDSEESQAQLTPGKPDLVNKRLTRTRFGGRKHPPTRDASETPSVSSTPSRKRAATPVITEPREGTPKRQKVTSIANITNGPLPVQQPPQQHVQANVKPKHPNQYTKARERELAAQQAARAAAGGAVAPLPTMPDFASMTVDEKLNRKWTDDELRASINADHTWLNPDPTKAAEWRDKILQGVNPVRSWSMVKKWSQWKGEGKDKRPRKKVLGGVNGVAGGGGAAESASASASGRATPAEGVFSADAGPGPGPGFEKSSVATPQKGTPPRGTPTPMLDEIVLGGPVGGEARSRRSSGDDRWAGTNGSFTGESRSRSGTPGTRPTPTRRSARNR
ncbi:uncharacterized protein HMPREF1541_03613 [Cyphellophora europaea CBS 101466]|uniref:Uncharacterized protein n=1 Tax=Cyphellophora europaea (strain CBS 101466) TaxID=1220924 RepID=W2RYZ3_CYPE1|nr:uncharacterized protein HMPREF1541_03613 [Cyphellophora europaea CBS 101466]ETN41677.1 hypothetical protein HMPREF1541_03613 [Cyphellophora europaea CBS 101466]